MMTNELIQSANNKHIDVNYSLIEQLIELKHEVTSLRDQTDCMQKSVANLRREIYTSKTETSQNKDKRFWIHW